MDQAGHSIIDVTWSCLHVHSLTLGNHNSLVFPSSPSVPSLDLPSLLVAELGLLPGQNLTGRCLTLDTSAEVARSCQEDKKSAPFAGISSTKSSSQETVPISVAGVSLLSSLAANLSGSPTAVIVECARCQTVSALVKLFNTIFSPDNVEECADSGAVERVSYILSKL